MNPPKDKRSDNKLNKASSASDLRWRVGLLVTALVMGLALVLSGIERYRATSEASREITRAEVSSLLQGARRELVRSRGDHEEIIDAVFEELSEGGVRYLGIHDQTGELLFARGEAHGEVLMPWKNIKRRDRRVYIDRIASGDLVRAFVPLGSPKHMRHIERGKKKVLVLDMEPSGETRLKSAARRALFIEVGAALILLLATAVFWRLSRKAEVLSRQVAMARLQAEREQARDQQLKMLGQMSAVLGHELKNPVAALKGHAQLLAERMEGDAETKVQVLVTEAIALERLVQQVLDFARSGQLVLERVYVDDLAQAAVTFAEVDPVQVIVPEESTPWQLDRGWMERVLTNLLYNARQASGPEDAVELQVEVGDSLRIEVRDRGTGITPGEELDIFEPFHTGRAKGTGLGLTLAKQIVEAHGGTIQASNRPEGGAVFVISIPEKETDA